jgi:APA family basic amino acid/polyamine antiporter
MAYVRELPLEVTIIFSILALGDFVGLCIFHLWAKDQNIPETFKCPLVPLVPCIGIAINSYMLAGLEAMAWIRLVVWLVIGLVIYSIYGIRFSKMRLYNMRKKELGDWEDTDSKQVN